MDIENVDIMTGKNLVLNLGCYYDRFFNGQFGHQIGGKKLGYIRV